MELSEMKLVDGKLVTTRSLSIDPTVCQFLIMAVSHYRDDGTCKCDDPEEQTRMIKEWGYKRRDFKKRK